jgi:toxin secretion/phage lysis holin
VNTEKITFLAATGALFASWFGGWDGDMWTLTVFMAADWITGLIVAGVFHNSPKTANGALESNVGLKGLCRKGAMLLIVLVAARLDILACLNGILRAAVIIALICNEALSILENVGLMGVEYPKIIKDAIDKLQGGKSE